ncbi:MAG: ABC-F family ATP-binding cassette domain-containing protein [Candidatus Izemoplasmatales bacterium]|nr:ABC-F family ATP-binding cassette domain-containing protein [Candidatus Izemoplasmatales bacterium]MDY0372618.1 ABC-F family ATP-binding cassette domain-containing protein [Candidatus Izemoplasmatales bacterium]NLF49008.1 ABC-F family ATP-binding cassette domain-containing protein [Acholeplasmataceae bacterium]
MNLIRLNNIKKSFGGTLLFQDVSFDVGDSDKVAIIGKNGVGKSTLFKLILKEIAPDSGDIFIFGDTTIGYLSQEVLSGDSRTLMDEMLLVFQEVERLGDKLREITEKMAANPSDAFTNEYGRLEELYRFKGGYEYQTFIDMILSRFGFGKTDYDRQVGSFSGGEKTRIAFAKILLAKPDVLLLDEPTNHMDIEIIEWLEDYLKRYEGAVVVITHDKYFIDKVAREIYEFDNEHLEKYSAPYDKYLMEKVARYDILLKQYQRQQKEISHLQSFVDRFRYKATKAKSAQDRIKKLNRIERIELPKSDHRHISIAFSPRRPTDAVILEISNLVIGYDRPLAFPITLAMRGTEKIGIIGPNGIGKTTFIKTLLGEVEPLNGSYDFPKNRCIGYFDQQVSDLPSSGSLIECVHSQYPQKTIKEIRTLLGRFLFTGEDDFKDISVLSGGEKVRLRLLLLMCEQPDFLILDEPTNHLDIETKGLIEDVFNEYNGPILFISHDRYFINKVATKILAFDQKQWLLYSGNYDDYKTMLTEQKSEPIHSIKRKTGSVKKLSYKELETKFIHTEKEVQLLKQQLFNPDIYSNHEKYRQTERRIEELEQESNELLIQMERSDGFIEN